MEFLGYGRLLLGGGSHIHSCYLLVIFSIVFLFCTAGPASIDNGGGSPSGPREMVDGGRRSLQANTTSSDAGEVPVVIAEGGAQYLYPEMTMRAYEQALESGADFVTCMITITSDQQAICHPDFELSSWTDILNHPKLISRTFRFRERLGLYSFNFTLAEIRTLRARQTKPEGRTKSFGDIFGIATPEEVIAAIELRAAMHPSAKRVGIALEMSNGTMEMEALGIGPSPARYAVDLLQKKNWTTLEAPAMVIATVRSDLELFVKEGMLVQRLLRALPSDEAKVQLGEDLSDPDLTATAATPKQIAVNATGIMLHVGSVLLPRTEYFWGKSIPRVYWDNTKMAAARAANLSVFVWGFEESHWSSAGPSFNTFLSDPLAMYRSLLYGNVSSFVAGLATDWPSTAAKAAACYKNPAPLFPLQGLAVDRPLIIASGGSVGLLPAHTNLSYLQAIIEGADYLDCTLQTSKDGVPFCLESMQLSRYTDIYDHADMLAVKSSHSPIPGQGPSQDWWTFDFLWKDIQTLKVIPGTRNNEAVQDQRRLVDFYKMLPPILFDDLLSIALNASREIGIYVKIDYPTFVQGLGRSDRPEFPVDQIGVMLETLRRRGYLRADNVYDPAHAPPLLVASADRCGLARLHAMSNGTLPLVKRVTAPDTCEMVTQEAMNMNTTSWWLSSKGLNFVMTLAGGISPPKKNFLKINNRTETPYDGLIDPDSVNRALDGIWKELDVYPRVFRNDVAPGDGEGAYDFLSDPTMELAYYFDTLKARALDVQFVSTAAGLLESSCRARPGSVPTDPGFNITELQPGSIAAEIKSYERTAHKRGEPRARTIGGIVMASVLLIAALGIVAAFTNRSRLRGRTQRDSSFTAHLQTFTHIPTLRFFSHEELQLATNGFSEANRLGKGGFGTVYKGLLPDAKPVAVKKLHVDLKTRTPSRSGDPVRQLLNEVEIIGTVHNRNVVPLEGLCVDGELLLVYEFMPNGSLQDAIFSKDYPIRLNWRQWYNIAVGTAKGLAYLHEECEVKIIHRDIKPANILLDAQLNARVADFGLARNMEVDATHVTTKVMGSVGFMAPDYVTTGQLTERSDTYSFGILLVTMLTGRLPISWEGAEQHEEPITLEWVKKKAQEGAEELLTVIHPKFEGMYDESEAIRWLYIALLCAQPLPALRPGMGDVVQMLLGKREVPEFTVSPAEIVFPDYLARCWNAGPSYSESSTATHTRSSPTPVLDSIGAPPLPGRAATR